MNKATLKAISRIKEAGFSHIKIELEAHLDRYNGGSGWEDCENCGGTGYVHFTDDAYNDYENECASCYGEGQIETDSEQWNEDDCDDFIRCYVSTEARSALTYGEFYEDGSVDSEYTFTLPVDKVEYALEYIRAFNALADRIGNGMVVGGAGMHISVLPSGAYPIDDELPYENLENFTRQVSKLLPALYVMATSGDFSRSLNYRGACISHDDKYTAIYTHDRTCLEYRLFETCYQRPEALYEFIGTIAKTLEYYIDPTKSVQSAGERYELYTTGKTEGLVKTEEQVKVVRRLLPLVRPDGYTLKHIMETRSIDVTLKSAREKARKRIEELTRSFEDEQAYIEERLKADIPEGRVNEHRELMAYYNLSPEEAKLKLFGLKRKTLQEYINENINTDRCAAVMSV